MRRPGSNHDLIVVGGGLSGLTAAWHAARNGMNVAVMEPGMPGGLVANIGRLDGFPSIAPVGGAALGASLEQEIRRLGGCIYSERLTAVQLQGSDKRVHSDSGVRKTKRLVLAMGARLRPLQVPGFETFWGRGVSQCAFCDAGLYKGSRAVVVGGGNAALQEALHLCEFANEVVLVNRGRRLRASPHYVARAVELENLSFRWQSEVAEILGDSGATGAVTGARLRQGEAQTEAVLACEGVFVFIGLQPNTEPLIDQLELNERAEAVVDSRLQTSCESVFAVGALRAGFNGTLTGAAADGVAAALALIDA